jgi:hypothetical protein
LLKVVTGSLVALTTNFLITFASCFGEARNGRMHAICQGPATLGPRLTDLPQQAGFDQPTDSLVSTFSCECSEQGAIARQTRHAGSDEKLARAVIQNPIP